MKLAVIDAYMAFGTGIDFYNIFYGRKVIVADGMKREGLDILETAQADAIERGFTHWRAKNGMVGVRVLEAPVPTTLDNAYFIVDDVINERGDEGYEVMVGNPRLATGFSQAKFFKLSDAIASIPTGEPIYRTWLKRRHGVPRCKIIRKKDVA